MERIQCFWATWKEMRAEHYGKERPLFPELCVGKLMQGSSGHGSHRRCQRQALWPLEETSCSDRAFLGHLCECRARASAQ